MSKKRFKYTLFYHRKDLELYAYTDDKRLADGFESYRRKDIFIKKKKELTSEQLEDLHDEYSGGLLREVKYTIGNDEIPIVVTMLEEITVMNCCINAIESRLPRLVLSLPPNVFTKDMQSALADVGYISLWDYVENKTKTSLPITPNYIACFFYLYGDTISWNGG